MKKLVAQTSIILMVFLFVFPAVVQGAKTDSRVRKDDTSCGAEYREEFRQEQRNPDSPDQRHFFVEVKLDSIRPTWVGDNAFEFARIDVRHLDPFGNIVTETVTGGNTRSISYYFDDYRSYGSDLTLYIRTDFDWVWQGESLVREVNLPRVYYTFSR